jgi:hypothetical protein
MLPALAAMLAFDENAVATLIVWVAPELFVIPPPMPMGVAELNPDDPLFEVRV